MQFQPVVALSTAAVVGFEALLRWEHPDRGLLLPTDFLAAVHPAGLAREIGEAVLAAAVGVLAELRRVPGARPEVDPSALTVAVNVGSDQFRGPGLAAYVLGLLTAHDLPGSAVTVEVTETTMIADMAVAATELGRLRTAGVGVCLDDYGSGTSGLHRLLQLPFSSLKLDHRLTGGLGADPRVGAVAASTAALAADLGLHLTAGGVETVEQYRLLLAAGYTHAQGWRFGRPVPPEQVPALLTVPRVPPRGWHPSQGPH